MSAYYIVDVTVADPALYEEYRVLVAPTLKKYGGKFLVRGGNVQTIEGNWHPERFVILEFEDTAQFQRWYYSPEYTTARNIRFRASTAQGILVEGI